MNDLLLYLQAPTVDKPHCLAGAYCTSALSHCLGRYSGITGRTTCRDETVTDEVVDLVTGSAEELRASVERVLIVRVLALAVSARRHL